MKDLEKCFFILLLFLLPSQLAFHFWPSWAFVFGIRVDYLAPAVYLTDVLVVLLVAVWFIDDFGWIRNFIKQYRNLLSLVLGLAVLNILFSTSVPVSAIKWAKALELLLLSLYVFRQNTLERKFVITILFTSAIFFSLIGVAQFFKGGTLGGIFYYFGERTFNTLTPGIALVSIFGREFLRAYSTFSHPNSLAGFLGIIIILKTCFQKKFRLFEVLGLLIIGTGFLLAFSLAAFIALVIIYIFRNRLTLSFISLLIFLSLALPLVSQKIMPVGLVVGQSVSQRLDLVFVTGKMISERFLVGEGIGTFTANVSRFKGIFAYEWLLQPVHNIFLLILAETGIVGFLAFCYGIYKYLLRLIKGKKVVFIMCFMFIALTGFLDHYWLTLQQNLLLLSLLIGLSFHPHTKLYDEN